MSLSLTSIVLVSAMYFYASFRKTSEENIINLQLPAIVDACFISIEDKLKKQASQGEELTGDRDVLSSFVYTSKGFVYSPVYSYSIQLLQENRVDNHRSYLLIVYMTLALGNKHTVSEQRSLCLIT